MKLLVTTPWNQGHIDQLRQDFPTVELVHAPGKAEIMQNIADTEVIFGRIDLDMVLGAKKLRWVQSHGAGVETMAPIKELADSDIIITNTRGAHGQTIAEHTFGMLVALARDFRTLFHAQEQHVWLDRTAFHCVGLAGLTLGVVGLGNIGRQIARRGWAFDMKVIAVDANEMPKPDYVETLWGLDRLGELLRAADAVAISVPLTPETRGMIGTAELALMKPSAYLLLVSRGGIVDEAALVAALKEQRLAGAGLDVTSTEPLPAESPLWTAPNLILTPHMSGTSEHTWWLATDIFRQNLRRYLAGEPLNNLVDLKRGY